MNMVNATLLGRVAAPARRRRPRGARGGVLEQRRIGGGSNGGISLGSGSSSNDPVSPDFAIAYIKRTLPKATDPNAITLEDDLRVQRVWNGPADVLVRERASPPAARRTSPRRSPARSRPTQ